MPKHRIEFAYKEEDFEEYLIHACIAAEKLGWTVTYISESGMQAESPASIAKNTWGEEITLRKKNTGILLESKSKGSTLFDYGRNKKNVEAMLQKIEEVSTTELADDKGKWKQVVEQNQNQGENDLLNPDSEAAREEKKWWKIFIPAGDFFITPLIIDLNILLFVLMVISSGSFEALIKPDSGLLLNWGANYKPNTVNGEWWRLITCVFEHIGIIHLLMNMYALLYVGIFLEPLLGRIRFTVAYLATGVAASLISLWWHDNTISAGASGAIFGMYGVFLFMLLTNIIAKDVRKSMLQSIGIFIGYNLLFGLKAGVDNAAHIGGLVSGFAIGAILYISVRQPENKRIEKLISGAVLVTVVLAAWILIPRVNNPVGDYIKIMDEFVKQENEALAVFRVPDNTNTDTYLEVIEKKSIPAWKKCREQIEKAKQLKLPPELSKRVNLIDEYVSHRIKETELRQKALREESDQYNEDINNEVKKIEELIKELTGS